MSEAALPESPPDADVEAMKRLADGDDLALNGIMHRWKDKVAAFLYRMTGSPEAAADLAQETFVRLYQSRARYQPTAAFPTYLFRIAANLGRNHARWRTRHPTVSVEDCTATLQQLPGHDASPDEAAEQQEVTLRIEKAIASLPSDLREALHLFTYQEMSQHEISLALGCSIKAVETRIYRARQMLKEMLADLRPA
ncbi:MAG: sigma-70 family RNA polymerase sigma factor [Verrucomicrobiaceae bacterium]|nr:sigma-70 family RNA polymerase sigma factor [Verrucomicrobiaceae bacterium]